MPAADVEQASSGDLRGDQIEQMGGGRAAPGLLAEVGIVAHVAVERVQLVAGGQERLLDRPALDAGQQIAVAPGLVQGGREGLSDGGVPVATGDAQAQVAGADSAGGLRRHGAGFPHERATLHVASLRQRHQPGLQRALAKL